MIEAIRTASKVQGKAKVQRGGDRLLDTSYMGMGSLAWRVTYQQGLMLA
jgi:hypothetical protein